MCSSHRKLNLTIQKLRALIYEHSNYIHESVYMHLVITIRISMCATEFYTILPRKIDLGYLSLREDHCTKK